MRKTRAIDDAGNVVIEMVLAVSLFGSILMPAVETISTVAAAYRIGENAAAIVARTWTVTESAQRAEVVTNLRAVSQYISTAAATERHVPPLVHGRSSHSGRERMGGQRAARRSEITVSTGA